MNILIINGPNLNLLGKREKSVYGENSFESYLEFLRNKYSEHQLVYFQSNIEGELINTLHQYGFGDTDGIVLNAGAYTHTSIAISDAIRAINVPVIEVHISNIHAREAYRHTSMIAAACKGSIAGFGMDSYRLAIEALISNK
ncbi:type II 3-dehydroquinate dehydratase [Coprobacter fastidiosus]|uniref:3-dehydroquinate dehydratase n=1 Tax=Coprobacter fastidiosus NSB1 = JCM 33896 TaxID=1349822 RepID=A0A495WB89_9BACT|nr:type II 3-dehydroquinate dehydratase [Coprobacter fastidiosus]ERM90292.1 3-dehydroquinate dehydratase [Coprobacter fastidiosus NSB1 = JCM 33896]RKT58966.1 3-dehydroquinate dehydratase [Coprobacter fastidiosus NSB1 = JCM 33896]BEG62747.1 type II 3-dehydroquinate dehydratase [Coprobacter fastidiosus]HJF42945.1 type II 3-dehydroquinate dehydratase [Coprobacter fastidiosus]